MPPITFFLRRTNGSRKEYLYLFAESLAIGGEGRVAGGKPLPGGSKTTVTGSTSNNFGKSLGQFMFTINVVGDITQIDSTQYPTLDASSDFIYETGVTPTAATQTRQAIRDALVNYYADQKTGGSYTNWELGWPNWGATITNPDSTINGTATRAWRGLMINPPNITENVGVGDFPYSFVWTVLKS